MFEQYCIALSGLKCVSIFLVGVAKMFGTSILPPMKKIYVLIYLGGERFWFICSIIHSEKLMHGDE